jgi:hypothetical protein
MFLKSIKTTHLITRKRYNRIVGILLKYEDLSAAERRGEAARYNRKYRLQGPVKSTSLQRQQGGQWLKVPTYEKVFEIIHQCHLGLGHAKDRRKNKLTINKEYYGIPTAAIMLYLSLCPNCTTSRRKLKVSKRNPLKMILSKRVGHRCQADLIDMQSSENPVTGDKYILRYADHLSGYGHVRPLKNRSSAVVGRALVEILSESVEPFILQSDNGSEFLGE